MSPRRLLLGSLVVLSLVPVAAGPAGGDPPTDDPRLAAQYAAGWLATQVQADGSVSGGFDPVGDAGTAALALAAAGVEAAAFERAVAHVEANVETYIAPFGTDNPGRLGRLLMVIVAAGADPSDFGGTDPLGRLAALLGADGAYGSAADRSNFNQGLALLGLMATGGPVPPEAVAFLVDQQCGPASPETDRGGWAFTVRPAPAEPCGAFEADTNTTALATEVLAQLDQEEAAARGLGYLDAAQNDDGGLGFAPGQASDPSSTGLAIQAVLAAGEDPTTGRWREPGGDPYTSLLSWQFGCDEDASVRGAFTSAFTPGEPSLFSVLDATPAAAGRTFPLLGPVDLAPGARVPCGAPTTPSTTTTTVFAAVRGTPLAGAAVPVAAQPTFTG